ncbi:uncharacterized protein TNIN_201951, partial [Trichonephila inaurata madagascariensis]
TISSM